MAELGTMLAVLLGVALLLPLAGSLLVRRR
jgi:hypothetical protein